MIDPLVMRTNLTYPKTISARNWGIDCLRGLSILLVMLNHLGLSFRLPLKKSLLADYVPRQLLDTLCFNGYEAVFIFFVISGFLITSKVLSQSELNRVNLRHFYLRRASRILPLLLLLLVVLSVLHCLNIKDYVIRQSGQSLPGALVAALGLYLNWYEGQTTWLPASWDVLWSLSIEEVFYLAFPLLCLRVPRPALIIGLALLALSLPLTRGALDGNEIWQEKAYLPGMAAIAAGVLGAIAAYRWPNLTQRKVAALFVLGGTGLVAVLFGLIYKLLGHGSMLVLTFAAAALVVASHQASKSARAPKGLGWLAAMGRLSYEIYLSHMFVVLSAVAIFRYYAPDLSWGFAVYVPCIAVCFWLGAVLERWVTQPCEKTLRRGLLNAKPAVIAS